MSEGPVLQDPSETLDHTLDWTNWLAGDVISTHAWVINPSDGVTLTSADAATVFVSDLTLGQVYELTDSIETTAGRTGSDSIIIRCFTK